MKSWGLLTSLLAGVAFLAPSVAAADASSVPKIVAKGKHFFYSNNGSEFFIRGVAYQQDYNANGSAASNADYTDPLADPASCKRDIPYLLQLRTNVIRTYAVDPNKDHSGCMNAFAQAGIYIISDLSAPSQSINRDNPAWTDSLYARYVSVIDDLSQYNNVIGFFAGNEVTNSADTTAASAFVKAAVRDSKAHIAKMNYQNYVGYATYDGDQRDDLADYFNCGDSATTIDFWGYNVYSWCGNSNYELSGYDERTNFFRNYSVPTFFAEYGCIKPYPRIFTEVGALFGPNMTGVWSGGIVYMYFQEINNYGLVSVSGNTVSKLPGFNALSSQQAMAEPSSTAMNDYTATDLPAQSCPSVNPAWEAIPSPLPPTPNGQLCSCLTDSLSCVVKDSTDTTTYGSIFTFICSKNAKYCNGFSGNGTTGSYGAYAGCNDMEKLSYAMNQYYIGNGKNSQACDFSGAASMRSATSPSGSCSSLLSLAGGMAGTGAVASNTGAIFTPSGALAGASSPSSQTNAASPIGVSSSKFTGLFALIYVAVAVVSGAGMLLL